MARVQFYHKNCLKLRNGKYDARISKKNVSIWDLNYIHPRIWFLHNILWVFIVSWQKTFVAAIQSRSPLISTKDEVNFDHLTIAKWKQKNNKIFQQMLICLSGLRNKLRVGSNPVVDILKFSNFNSANIQLSFVNRISL